MQIRSLILNFVDNLPEIVQRKINKIVIETNYFVFMLRTYRKAPSLPNPTAIYWISPTRISHQTNYIRDKTKPEVSVEDRVFNLESANAQIKTFGSILEGDWDISEYKFTDMDVYQAFHQRFLEKVNWKDTAFYEKTLRKIEAKNFVWGLKSEAELVKRCEYLDWLYETIKKNGYKLNRNNNIKNTSFDEVTVNIGRNGEYLFENGRHRLSIALILGIKVIPVMVCVRHKKWQEFRELAFSLAKQSNRGVLYQPLLHPDLADIPHSDRHYFELIDVLSDHLKNRTGVMLDIGANLGFFSHKFEDIGFECYAVERDPATFEVLERVRIAENKKFKTINASIFDVDYLTCIHFDVVLALNIFHHFLKRKILFDNLKKLLEKLNMDSMFFEPHLPNDEQMAGAFVNFKESEFVKFVMEHASFTKYEIIYTDVDGRHVYLLSK
jgi:hypothetical protein